MEMYKPNEFAKMVGVSVKTLQRWDNESLSPEEEMVQDLISIIHVFSCRIDGLRKYKKKIESDDKL